MAATNLKERLSVKPLPYDYEALAPIISPQTLRLHYDKHYKGYLANTKQLIENTPYSELTIKELVQGSEGAIFNNAAQVWNHEFYFEALSTHRKCAPEGDLLVAINRAFGSFDEFLVQFKDAASKLFGSGWVWLIEDPMSDLFINAESNAGTPLTRNLRPLLTIDLWEHAYYVDYQNRRADAIEAHLKLIDWAVVEQRYQK